MARLRGDSFLFSLGAGELPADAAAAGEPDIEPDGEADADEEVLTRGEVLARARAVKSALRRRRLEHEHGGVQHSDDDGLLNYRTFGPRQTKDAADMSHSTVTNIVFDQHVAQSARCTAQGTPTSASKLQGIRRWTLFRYVRHRAQSWRSQLSATRPLAMLVMSMQIKWDETQQQVHCFVEQEAPDGVRLRGKGDEAAAPPAQQARDDDLGEAASCQQVVSVMSSVAYLKTSNMPQPWPWVIFPRMLERTTAENIFKALVEVSPVDLTGRGLPPEAEVRWIWIVCVADQASSNKRLQAHAEATLIDMRGGVLFCSFPCVVHILHRSVVPLLKINGINTKLYRTSHVLGVSSYWTKLYASVMTLVEAQLVIVHNYEPRNQDRLLAEQILRLTWCNGMPDELLSKCRVRVKNAALQVLVGNWASQQFLYRCRNEGCRGGVECRQHAVTHSSRLLSRMLFSRRVVSPTISRWWKRTPLIRIVGLGLCCHGLWPRACPRTATRLRGQPPHAAVRVEDVDQFEANDDEHWHAIHNFRCQRTWDFFHESATAFTLMLVLLSLSFAHKVMAWAMSRDGMPARCKQPFRTLEGVLRERHDKRPKPEVMLEFFDPRSSPVWSALADGSMSMHETRGPTFWRAAVVFHRGSTADAIRTIWRSVLPALALMWLKVAVLTLSWPWRLLLLLSADPTVRETVAREFHGLLLCCVPRGIKALFQAFAGGDWRQLLCYECKVIVQEPAWQLDLSIFDREMSHASTQSHIERANGAAPKFENICHAQFGKEVMQHFKSEQAPPPQTQGPGRPSNQRQKRLRYDSWNAYVSANKPRHHAQRAIGSGDHMKSLSEKWDAEPQHIKMHYARVAAAELARRHCDRLDSQQAEPAEPQQREKDDVGGQWSMACETSPMTAEAISTPEATPELLQEVECWSARLAEKVKHENGLLPDRVSYDGVCSAICCKHSANFDQGEDLAFAFNTLCKAAPTSVFLFLTENVAGYSAAVHMVALSQYNYSRRGNKEMVFLRFVPEEGTTNWADVESAVNFPWHLRMDFELSRYSGKMTLPFDLHIEVFKRFLAAPGEFVDIVSMECEIDPVSYDRLRVTSTKEPITLQSNLFADVKDVRGPAAAS